MLVSLRYCRSYLFQEIAKARIGGEHKNIFIQINSVSIRSYLLYKDPDNFNLMGVYLSTPKTEKNTLTKQNSKFKTVSSDMQGGN